MAAHNSSVTSMEIVQECSRDVQEESSEEEEEEEEGATCTVGENSHEIPRGRRHHVSVTVDLESSVHTVSKSFLSVALGAKTTQRMNHTEFRPESEKLQTIAAALAPCGLRLGGTYMQTQLFSPDGSRDNLVPDVVLKEWERRFGVDFWLGRVGRNNDMMHYLLTGAQWDKMSAFIARVGWDLIYDFNNILYAEDGSWDTSNAALFLDYSAQRGIKIAGFQLGNEPNSQGYKFEGVGTSSQELARDMKLLKELLSDYPLYKDCEIIGPDVTQKGLPRYFGQFFEAGGKDVVNYASFHHYYGPGKTATVKECLKVEIFNQFEENLEMACRQKEEYAPALPLALTETASFYGGGAPDLSNRYAAGFLWMDKLGLCAKAGVARVYRQTFYGSDYSLIDLNSFDPYPDYYLSLLYKKLIEGPVFEVTFSPHFKKLRLYANQARTDSVYEYPEGSIVLYYINAHRKPKTLTLTQFHNRKLDLFMMTHGDGGLRSRFVKLNGTQLEMSGAELPDLEPLTHFGDVTVSGHSFGFIVIPNVEEPCCSLV